MKVKEDDSKFEVTLDVSDYRPEELKVTTVNNVLSIEGKHEQKTEDSKVKFLILTSDTSCFLSDLNLVHLRLLSYISSNLFYRALCRKITMASKGLAG